jgi:signal transduction histidine kinase
VATAADKATADVSAVLELILVSAVEILHGSAGAVAIFDDQGQQLVTRAGYGLSQRQLESLHPALDQAILASLGRTGEAVSAVAVPGDNSAPSRLWRVLAIPLRVEQRLLGVIYVFRSLSSAPFMSADLQVLDVFARQAAGALEQAHAQAELLAERLRLQELQNTFVSIVSHELQTPVSIIKGYAGTLRRQDASWGPEVVQRVAETIEAECDRLTRLITDLLDLARIQAGRVAMTFGPVDLAELVGEVVEQARARAAEREIALDDVSKLPVIRGDYDKLRMALNNLIDNALKYSAPAGTVSVGGSVKDQQVVLWVRDEGVGVPTEERERIFERFHRVDASLSRETPGVGMGLYICRVIAEAHNGHVWVESEGAGRGSTFFLSLPLVEP